MLFLENYFSNQFQLLLLHGSINFQLLYMLLVQSFQQDVLLKAFLVLPFFFLFCRSSLFHYGLENSQVLDLEIAFSAASFIQLVRSTIRSSTYVLKLLSLFLYNSSREARGPFSPISIQGFSSTSSSRARTFASSSSS